MTQLDYTFDRQLLLEREEARTEGRAEGIAEGKAEGRAEGIAEGKAEGRAEGKEIERELSIEKMLAILQELGCPTAEGLKQLKSKYQIEGEQAEEYMRTYWKSYK